MTNEQIRFFVRDAIEGAITVVIALGIVFPNSVDEAKQVAITVGIAIGGAILAAARRDLLPYLLDKFFPKPTQ
jgi:hypothetical protein